MLTVSSTGRNVLVNCIWWWGSSSVGITLQSYLSTSIFDHYLSPTIWFVYYQHPIHVICSLFTLPSIQFVHYLPPSIWIIYYFIIYPYQSDSFIIYTLSINFFPINLVSIWLVHCLPCISLICSISTHYPSDFFIIYPPHLIYSLSISYPSDLIIIYPHSIIIFYIWFVNYQPDMLFVAKLTDSNIIGLTCFWEYHCLNFPHSSLDWVNIKKIRFS